MDVTVNIKNLEKIQNEYGSGKIQQALDISIKKTIITLDRSARQETPVDRGRLRNAFQTEFREGYGRLFNPVDYAIYVQEGTGPHIAPRNAIQGRAQRKGLNAGVIRNGIMVKGTKANPFMDRAVENTDSEIDDIFQGEIDKIVLEFNRP